MDVVLGVYACIAQDKDDAEKRKRWNQTREITVTHARQLGIVGRATIDDHSNVIASPVPPVSGESVSIPSPTEPLNTEPMPTKKSKHL